MTPEGNPPHRSTSVPVAFRLPPELLERLDQAAETTGHDRSSYLRAIVFGATTVTAEAAANIWREARREERAAADIEIQTLRAQLDQAVQLRAVARQRIQKLEGDMRISSTRLVIAVRGVLWRAQGARPELNRLWACLESADRQRMLPALTSAIVESLEVVVEERSTLRYVRERDREVVAQAAWLGDALIGARESGEPSAVRATRVALEVATVRAERAIEQRGTPTNRRSTEETAPSPTHVTTETSGPGAATTDELQPSAARSSEVAPARLAAYFDMGPALSTEVWANEAVVPRLRFRGDPRETAGRLPRLNQSGADSAITRLPIAEAGQSGGDTPPPPPPTWTTVEMAQAAARRRVDRSEAAADMWDDSTLAGIKVIASAARLPGDPSIEVVAANSTEATHFERGE
jgi:hypothetical protein